MFGRTSSLAGVLSIPTGARRTPVVILGAGIIHKVGPSRVSVDLARTLASAGHPTLRFDLSGIGDSPRAAEPRLEEAVVADIHDAVTTLLESVPGWGAGVCLLGFCSGADNAFFVARSDPRVEALVLFDPTVHPTNGYRRRLLLKRLRSGRSWLNVLTGRSLWLRLTERESAESRPPGYYGLLITPPAETDSGARQLVGRGVRLLYVLSGAAQSYCNSPRQIAESMPHGYDAALVTVKWLPDLSHIFSGRGEAGVFSSVVLEWLASR